MESTAIGTKRITLSGFHSILKKKRLHAKEWHTSLKDGCFLSAEGKGGRQENRIIV